MKKKIIFKILCILYTTICLISFGVFTWLLFKINIIPNKYLYTGLSIATIIFILLLFLIYSKRKKVFKVIAVILLAILGIISGLGSNYLNKTYDFFNRTNNDYDTISYSVIALNNSSYNSLKDLSDKLIGYVDDDYREKVSSYLNNKISFQESLEENFITMSEELLNEELDAIVLEDTYLVLVEEQIEDFESNIKVIDTFDIQVESYKEATSTSVVDNPFILYISGIDQYGDVTSVRGRSDVNQLVVVNPKTNHILIVNTPRDYYVQLDGTTGLKDKLTHAGIYGINKSIKTLENFYDIDIDYYLRVNFNTLIQVVDVIGGIDIYSDQSFTAHTNKNVTVKEGWNTFNGEQALAYSRERYAYVTGDNHRGENQQQVISAIINKMTSSKVIISKYTSILNALDGSFQTDMSTETLTSFIKYQLDEMPSWTIETYAVTGTGSYDYTYSMGMNYKLYVMEPNYDSVETAKTKINEILNEA
jgi:LCP family protein required for cell wall assembly